MGNKFETLSSQFNQNERYSVILPVEIVKILQENLKTPYALYDFCNNMFSEPCMMFGFTMNKKEFILSVQKHLKLDGDGSDLLNIFNVFLMQSIEPMSGQPRKVVNVLEFLSALIMLANFGEPSQSDLHHNAELIEHKINLMLLLFDLRKSNSMNISEVIIMLRTSILSLSKVFPNVQFFKSQHILNEIKQSMVSQFQLMLESQNTEQKVEQQKADTLKPIFDGIEGEKSQSFLGFNKKVSVGREIGLGGPANIFTPSTGSSLDPISVQGTPTGNSALQRHITETLEEKKRRLFKWNTYERVLIPLDQIKDNLIRNRNVIKYLSLFSEFNKVTLVWGSNKNMSQGLHIHKDFQNFYKHNDPTSIEKVVGLSADKAVRELVNLSKKQSKDNDELLLFQALIQKWQDSLIIQRTQNEALQQNMMKAKKQYARVEVYTKPTLMMSMLNTQTSQIVANNRMTITKSPEGMCFSIGKDFRNRIADQDDRQFGIPRRLNIQQPVSQIALGKDHAVLLTTDALLYSMGSNQFGQLGYGTNFKKEAENQSYDLNSQVTIQTSAVQQFEEIMQDQSVSDVVSNAELEKEYEHSIHTFEHPINCEKIEYTPEPLPLSFRVFDDDEVTQVVAGDHHSMVLTARGKVYTWGLGSKGQLGVPRRKGQINNLLSKDGIQYSPKPVLVEALSSSVIEVIISKNNACFAISSSGNLYNWGHLPRGISLEPKDIIIDLPQKNRKMQPYSFKRIKLTKDSAIAVGKSVELKFEMPEIDESSSEYFTKNNGKKIFSTQNQSVIIHAIPVFDGQLIKSEKDLNDALKENPEMTLDLISDFDVPWYEYKSKSYPKYRKTLQLKSDVESKAADDSDKEQDKEEMEQDDEEQSDGGSDYQNQQDQNEDDDEKDGSDEEEKENKAATNRTAKSKKSAKSGKKHKSKKKYKDQEEMSKTEKREHETFQFKNRLNVNKPYFRSFINRFNGIAEADSADEMSKGEPTIREEQSGREDDEDSEEPGSIPQSEKKKEASEDDDEDESEEEDKAEDDEDEENESEEGEEREKKKKKKKKKEIPTEDAAEKSDKSQEEDEDESSEDQIMSSESSIDENEIILQFTNKNGILVDEAQLRKEEAYVPPDRPEAKKKASMSKLECYKIFENAQALLVNYLATDYNFFLKKIMGLIQIIPSTLRLLIVPLPKGAANVDTYQAKLIQRILFLSGEQNNCLTVLFIAWESHQQILKHFYRIEEKTVVRVKSEFTVSAKLSEGTLVYSWGSTAYGKLGTGLLRPSLLDTHSDFVREDLGAQLENEQEKGINQYYTFTPQPIVSLLGHKIRDLACGLQHCLALTSSGDLYSWGDNSQSQLGLDPLNLVRAVPIFPPDYSNFEANNGKVANDIGIIQASLSSGLNDNASEEQKLEDETQRITQFENQSPSLFSHQKQHTNQKKTQQTNQKAAQPGAAVKLSFAKVPYKVKTIENFDNLNGGQLQSGPGNAGHHSSIASTSAANPLNAETNPYELIACGDFNSYAVLSL